MINRRSRAVLAASALVLVGLAFGSTALAGNGAHVAVSKLSSAPVGASAGHTYTLEGTVTNSGGRAVSGPVAVRLMRVGSTPRVVGRTSVHVGALRSIAYEVEVKIPSRLARGSYALVACASRHGLVGPLGCATAHRHIEVGGRPSIRGPRATASLRTPLAGCSSGAHTLSHFGDHVYPETGNGGYISLHTDVHMVYDAATNMFLSGNHVDLTDEATQCLSDFSLDFERTSANATDGPNMTVDSVAVNGQPATFTFVQPTYPGDPNGQDDPDPNAHQISQSNPVGGPNSNPLPPACSPSLTSTSSATQDSQNGMPCPANKLVITPPAPIPSGATFTVTVNYTGRPGVHNDGDGTTEGWFRSDSPAGDGSFVTTEPVGTEDWMPLNNHPSAKPTYDFYDTVNAGKTAIANGELVSFLDNPPDANFPGGSRTWHWHSPEPIASYLVENSVGNFDLSERIASDGTIYYEAQGSSISASQKQANKAIMDQQEDITQFQSLVNGTFPFSTDGVVIGVPSASFQEEMQTKITFNGGSIGLQTFNHENMHQWWGDNVSEDNYNLTFFKEGLAVLGEYLYVARNAQTSAGGPASPAGNAAFESSLTSRFNTNYANTGSFWTAAPSDPKPFTLFNTGVTYTRPATSYIALRHILGTSNFNHALRQIQSDYVGGSITEPELEASFRQWMPNQSGACTARLNQFFTQWWDTVYATGGGTNRPQITGSGLAGPGFYDASCDAPPPTISIVSPADGATYEPGSAVPSLYSCEALGGDLGTTLFSAATAGATNIKVPGIPTGLAIGDSISVGSGGTTDWVSVTAIGTPAVNTTLAALSLPLDTNIKVASVDGLVVGDSITIDTGALLETRTIQSVGTAGAAGSGVTLTAALNLPHQSGATVADAGGGITLTPALGHAHSLGDPVTTGCTGTVPNGQPIDTSTSGQHTFVVHATDQAGKESTRTVTYFVSGVTAVRLVALTAFRSGVRVLVRWRTGSEALILGFNVYREIGGTRVRLNRAPILAKQANAGGRYVFPDRHAPRKGRLSYWIEAVALDGARTWFGPVRVNRSP